jgi:hypothetical protein
LSAQWRKRVVLIFSRFIWFALLAVWCVGMFRQFRRYRQYSKIRIELENDINKACRDVARLREQQQLFLFDRRFIERLAHERGYAYECEVIYNFGATDGGLKNRLQSPETKYSGGGDYR